jgi:hypothetical protein
MNKTVTCERVGAERTADEALPYSEGKVANRNVRDFGWEIARAAVSRRPPISVCGIVARTESYTNVANVWDCWDCPSLKDRFLSPVPNPNSQPFTYYAAGLCV